jgi:hypothetical protein
MKWQFDEDLIDAVVFLTASRRINGATSALVRRFHYEREGLYSILDPDERNDAFFQLHLSWFREWRYEEKLTALSREFPLLETHLDLFILRRARRRKEEGSELFVSKMDRRGVMGIQPERFLSSGLEVLFRHEAMHLHDMVDPAFQYTPGLALPGRTAVQHKLALELYRLLWDITIDGRLRQAGKVVQTGREAYLAQFNQVFASWTEEKRSAIFEELWSGAAPAHQRLLQIISAPGELKSSDSPLPGAACPVCGFSSFTWNMDAPDLVIEAVRETHPEWQPEQGICARCVEVFESLKKFALPSTIFI